MMNRRNAAFTLVELMIAMAIVMLVLYAAINFFIVSVRQYKVQTKITETNVEGILGLELFRQDLESLGYGLPWNNLGSYTEKTGNGSALNDGNGIAPRAVLSIDNAAFTVNSSDYLVIKSARVGMSDAAGKWTTLRGPAAPVIRLWGSAEEDLAEGDRVIVLSPGSSTTDPRVLLTPVGGSAFGVAGAGLSAYTPNDTFNTNIVYGIDNVQPVRPFNRAEYYIDNTDVSQHCAPNTGVLVKAVVAHDVSGSTPALLPLLDCVADMKVVYGIKSSPTDNLVTYIPNQASFYPPASSTPTAADIRSQLVEIRVHILAQEGQRDDSYTTPSDTIFVGSQGVGRNFDVSGYRNYRWKQYSISVKPKNLAQ